MSFTNSKSSNYKNNKLPNLCYGIDINKYTYIRVVFSKKDDIKKLGAKWEPTIKLWYMTKNNFNKNKLKIQTIGDEIIWNDCMHCQGYGTFQGDKCWFC